jgi:hypothetical protein
MDKLTQIKNLIIQHAYRTSGHVLDGIDAGEFDEDDLEQCILYATQIHKRERDELN